LKKRGLKVERQVAVKVQYDSIIFEEAFRADVVIENKVILEIKGVEQLHPIHKKQLLTYLRLTNMRLGLVINFDAEFIRDGVARVVNGLPEDEA
jgi:GxxExxY protein